MTHRESFFNIIEDAHKRLQELNNKSNSNDAINVLISNLLAHSDKLLLSKSKPTLSPTDTEELAMLLTILKATNNLLQAPTDKNIKTYRELANLVNHRSSKYWRIMGGMMLALGTCLMLVGACLLSSLAYNSILHRHNLFYPVISALFHGESLKNAALTGGTGLGLLMAGYFAYSQRRSDLSNTMNNLGTTLVAQKIHCASPV